MVSGKGTDFVWGRSTVSLIANSTTVLSIHKNHCYIM